MITLRTHNIRSNGDIGIEGELVTRCTLHVPSPNRGSYYDAEFFIPNHLTGSQRAALEVGFNSSIRTALETIMRDVQQPEDTVLDDEMPYEASVAE